MGATPFNLLGTAAIVNGTNRRGSARLIWLGPSQTIGREIMIIARSAEIRVRRYDGVPECDVVVFFRGQAMTLRCRDYDQAVEWARIECKAYKVAEGFTVERPSTERNSARDSAKGRPR
jgi:hypothetical protein